MKNKNISKVYNDFVRNNFISYDKRQEKLIEKINLVWGENKKFNFFSNYQKFDGIYVYGKVGIGKTFILNLFIQNTIKSKKIHFNHFMISLHAFINNSIKEKALEIYIKDFSKNYKTIFIDELHIFNIVDALLIKKIFLLFKKYKVFILISSNFQPEELYKDGLQRSDFIPYINFILKNYKIINLEKVKDYRRQMLNQSKTYFTPVNSKTSKEFLKLFRRFVDNGEIHIRRIKTKSRYLRFEKCTSNILLSLFKDLCQTNLAHEDYSNIAKAFKLVFIENVPCFTESESDQCRRFISLIDMLYEQECSVVILAEKPINNICQISKLKKEFERTASRLYEMTIIN